MRGRGRGRVAWYGVAWRTCQPARPEVHGQPCLLTYLRCALCWCEEDARCGGFAGWDGMVGLGLGRVGRNAWGLEAGWTGVGGVEWIGVGTGWRGLGLVGVEGRGQERRERTGG